jgi:hypothetical protein
MSSNLSEGCRDVDPEETIVHLGGRRRLAGALTYTGTRKVTYSRTELRLYVNGKPGRTYVMSITVNSADLYDIALWDVRGSRKRSLGKRANVFFDELQRAVEDLYDKVMGETNDGVIPLG